MSNGSISIPNWFARLIGVSLPVIVGLATWANIELRGVRTEVSEVKKDTAGLRTDVAVLNVQMEAANKTHAQVEGLRSQIRELERIVDRLESNHAAP